MDKQERAFEELKKRFMEKPVLAAPDLDKKMRMEVDASDYTTGGVLSMEGEDRLWKPVAFLSKSLNETERNYEIHDKEMLGGWKLGGTCWKECSSSLRSGQIIKTWNTS